MGNLSILDVLVDYLNEHGIFEDMLDWYEMYDGDKEALEEAIENRYNNLQN